VRGGGGGGGGGDDDVDDDDSAGAATTRQGQATEAGEGLRDIEVTLTRARHQPAGAAAGVEASRRQGSEPRRCEWRPVCVPMHLRLVVEAMAVVVFDKHRGAATRRRRRRRRRRRDIGSRCGIKRHQALACGDKTSSKQEGGRCEWRPVCQCVCERGA